MAWQDHLGSAASISSLLQIACQITKFGYSYFLGVRDAHATREEYLKESRALVVVLLQLKQVLDSGEVQKHQDAATSTRRAQLLTVMSECGNGLSKIETMLGKAMGFQGVFWPLQQGQIRDHIKTFQQYRCMLDSFISANILATTATTLSKINPLVLSHERSQLLFAFPRPDTISKPRIVTCPGTGKWFLESTTYHQWIQKNSSVAFIWCYGTPGVGKSGLASLVVQRLLERQRLGEIHLCYFFCDFAAREKQSLVNVLQCIVYQLIEQGDGEVVNCAKESLSHFDAFKNPEILAELVAKISRLVKSVFLVLDAEDELDCREILKKYLFEFTNSGCRILITSRGRSPSGHNMSTPPPVVILELKMECPVEDIIKYATERFQESVFQFQISTQFMNQIVEKSNGIFLIAHILIEHLLQQTSVLEMKKVLHASPTEVNEVFESSLHRIDNQPPALSRLAHRVIGWIINARRLLTIAEMTHAFAVEDGIDDIDKDGLTNSVLILRVCAGLVTIDETETVRFVHTSVHDFFSTRQAGLREVQVDIAMSCIQYLCLKPMLNKPAKDVSELRMRLKALPFLDYASHYWGAHIQDVSSEEQLRSLILSLLANENTRCSAVQSLQFDLEVGNTTVADEFFASIPTGQAALHLSAYWGLSSITKELIESGADTSPRDSELWTPLHWAVANGHDKTVAILIEGKSDFDAKDSEGWTPLFWASFHGHISIVQLLLRAGASHRVKCLRGQTALHWSIWRDELEIAHTLLLHDRRDAKMPQEMGISNISMQDLEDIGEKLGLQGFKGDGYSSSRDRDPVRITINNLDVGAITAEEDQSVPTVLAFEPRGNYATLLNMRGQFRPPVSRSTWRTYKKSRYVFVSAAKKQLLYVTPNISIPRLIFMKNRETWKSNLLQSAIMTDDLAPARLLVELGADANARGDGLCPIFAALDAGNSQFLELLATNGADVSFIHERAINATKPYLVDPKGSKEDLTPLMYAAELHNNQSSEKCEILISHGADIKAHNSKDETALHFSALGQNVKTLKLLLSHGADVDAQDQKGASALHVAAEFYMRFNEWDDSFDMIELLLQSGADPVIRNHAGESPFEKFLIRICHMTQPQVSILDQCVQLFSRFGPSPSDLALSACANREAMKRAAGLKDAAILEFLLSQSDISSDDILRECVYSTFDHVRPRSLRLLMKHAKPFRVADNKHMTFLFLIKISRDMHQCCHWCHRCRLEADIPMEVRVRTAKPIPIPSRTDCIAVEKYFDILKDIWNAGFKMNTMLGENFVNLVSTYYHEFHKFSNLVEDTEQFGDPSSSLGRSAISTVVFAAQHIRSAMIVLELLRANSYSDNLTDEEAVEVFIRSAVYDNLEVYDGCRNAFSRQVGGSSDGIFKRPISPNLRRIAEVFPPRPAQGCSDFYRAFYQAMRTEGFDRKTFACGRTLREIAERAQNRELLDVLEKDKQEQT